MPKKKEASEARRKYEFIKANRGERSVRDEFLVTATVQKLRRMAKYLGTGPPAIPEMA